MSDHPTLHFILGGTRSGKSTHAERLAASLVAASLAQGADGVLYVATAEPFDDGMKERIARHQKMRPACWETLEAPLNVGAAICARQAQQAKPVVLIECMTLLACNAIFRQPDAVTSTAFEAVLDREVDAILEAFAAGNAHFIVVSSETNLGGIHATHMARVYGDALGRANQKLAAAASRVTFMVAGIPMQIKDTGRAGLRPANRAKLDPG